MNRKSALILCLALIITLLPPLSPVSAAPIIPPTWDIVSENFESNSLSAWSTHTPANLSLIAGGGRGNTLGLNVGVNTGTAYISQSGVAKATEGYLTFWLNPNGVAIPDITTYWPPEKAICIAGVLQADSDWWPPIVSLYLRRPPGQTNYKAYLAWANGSSNYYDYQAGEFDITNGWQKITLGYKINGWVAVWVNDTLVRSSTAVTNTDSYGDVIEIGKLNSNSAINPSGSIRIDEISFQVPRITDLWVDAANGNDANNGLTQGAAFRTIQKAADLAGPGTTVHIMPGVYRETIQPAMSGSETESIRYLAHNGPGTAVIRGSEPSSSLTWTALTGNTIGLPAGVDPNRIYVADLTAWNLSEAPRFITQMNGNGDVTARLALAREPDWQVATEWKYHEYWWAADGGSAPAACDPATNTDHNCDLAQRSMTQLTDRTNDSEPAGIEAGNLTTLGDLTGATMIAIDTYQGHYTYRRTITAHDVANGRITVNKICEHDGGTGNPGLGWGAKYYIENKPRLLDNPGEWWYDTATKKLYLWPLADSNPAGQNIEISRRDKGFNLQNRSYTTIDGLTLELINESAVYEGNWINQKSYHNTISNATLRYANIGLYIEQDVQAGYPVGNVIDGFTVENCEVGYMDTLGVRLIDWWENSAAADSFTHPGILNTTFRNNEFHHLGFRTDDDNAIGLSFGFANKLRFEGNHVHHVAHNGVQFSRSVIQSSKTYGFSPSEIKTGEILIKDNLIEQACQQNTDCGALKFWGSPPDNHVFRDVLITGNVFRNTYGWSYVSDKRNRYAGGTGSLIRGMGGYGLFVDHASGLHAYRNVSYNNAYTAFLLYGVWRDGEIVYWNNIAANSLYGFSVGGPQYDTHGNLNTRISNNIIINNEAFGMSVTGATPTFSNITIDHNLYSNNGWRSYDQGGFWHAGPMVVQISSPSSWTPQQSLAEIQANTIFEDHGIEGAPVFWSYVPDDHNTFDGSWPDWHVTSASTATIDRGATVLPASLTTLLNKFAVSDWHMGSAYDIGRYEGGYMLLAAPATQSTSAGGTVRYQLSLSPDNLPHAVTLTLASPSLDLTVTPGSAVLSGTQIVTVTVTDQHTNTLGTGLIYAIPITATGGGFTQTLDLRLIVGGSRLYLPLVRKN